MISSKLYLYFLAIEFLNVCRMFAIFSAFDVSTLDSDDFCLVSASLNFLILDQCLPQKLIVKESCRHYE